MKKSFIISLLTLFFGFGVSAQTWQEVAKSLPIPSTNISEDDQAGWSVSVDGNYAAIGANGADNDIGKVYVMFFNGVSWLKQAELTATDGRKFGNSVSISGNNIVVGAPDSYVNGIETGSAYVFTKPGTEWIDTTETAKLTASDGASIDLFGYSVAISGDHIVVGAYADDDNGSLSGSAYVFTKPGATWITATQTAKLTASDGQAIDRFGVSVSISGDHIVVGAAGDDNNGSNSGSAYVFSKSGINWVNTTQTARLLPGDGASDDYFGQSVSISGDNIVVGAQGDDDNGSSSGSAYVFSKSGTNWSNMIHTAKLTASDGTATDRLGAAVSISGDQIIVGAYFQDNNGTYSGGAYIYSKSGINWSNMTQTGILTPSDGASGDYFGYSVSISGDNVLIGAYRDDDNGTLSGSTYFYKKPALSWLDTTENQKYAPEYLTAYNYYYGRSVSVDGSYAVIGVPGFNSNTGIAYVLFYDGTNWIQQAELTASDATLGDAFGISVSISGDNIVVGASADDDNGSGSGSAYVFTKPGAAWLSMTQTAKLTASDGDTEDQFGISVSISGDHIVVGVPYDDDAGSNSGSAYVFSKPGLIWTSMTQTAKLTASDGDTQDQFGRSIAISGDNIVVGAPYDDIIALSEGSAYVFTKPGAGWTNMTQIAKLTASDAGQGDSFGWSVSISGDNIVVGANADNDAGTNSGSAYVFTKPGAIWSTSTQTAKLVASDAAPGDQFGRSVCISGDNIVIGAPYDGVLVTAEGSAYVFIKPGAIWSSMTQTEKLVAADGAQSDHFGISISLSGNNIVAGAHDDDDEGYSSGSAYLFQAPCTDTDSDGICDDVDNCVSTPNPLQADTDNDGIGDVCDSDDDNDGVADIMDNNPLDPTLCSDTDADGCDDCATGTDGFGPLADNNPMNDGTDTDGDGLCDSGDSDIDNDGVPNGSDTNPLDPTICADADADGCDDCATGTDGFGPLADNNPMNDGTDTDGDGLCDSGDPDIDNDGVPNGSDTNPLDPTICADADADGCDDCGIGTDGFGPLADNTPSNDGTDTDGDGLCDSGDPCPNDIGNDADGDGYCADVDCDDNNDQINPGMTEIECDGIDNDCNPATLDDVTPPLTPTLIDLTVDCNGTLVVPQVSDNCAGVVTGTTSDVLNYVEGGSTTITWTFDDGNGNSTTADQVYHYDDLTAPNTPVLAPITINCNGTLTTPQVSDNCAGVITGTTSGVLNFVEGGSTTITWTFDDGNGNSTTADQIYNYDDVTPPTAVCQNINAYLNAAGNTTIVASDLDGGSSDDCGTVNFTASNTSFTCLNLGPNNVTLTVDDGNGNSTDCVATVTVFDTISPTVVCQDITVFLDGTGSSTIVAADIDAGSTDNCGTVNLTASNTMFTCANLGANNVTLTAIDGNGNTSNCLATVTVVDTISPTAICQNINIYLDGAGSSSIVAADIDAGSTDNCEIANLTASNTMFTCADIGPNNVTLTVIDGNGNTDECIATVTVLDTISPVTVCQNITTYLDGSGNTTIVAADIDGGSSDNCGTLNLTASNTMFTCVDLGPNNVTLTSDDGNGNTSNCVATVTVVDTISPTVVCQDITVFLDGAGSSTIVAADIDAGSTDNCGTINLTASNTMFTCADLGPNNVTLTAIDGNGNTSNCIATVTVVDTISPTAICQNINIYLDGAGSSSIVATDIDGGSTDNCGIVNLTASNTMFTCADIGPNNVTLTVFDGNGNTDECIATVTVLDTISPVTPLLSDVSGECSAIVTAPTTTDNCSGTITGTTMDALTYSTQGVHTINWTFDDGNGNSIIVAQNVIINDVTPPTASNPDSMWIECIGDAIIDNSVVTDAFDNCSYTITHNGDVLSGNGCLDTISRTYRIEDIAGNFVDVTQMIFVQDTTAPTASNPSSLTVQCTSEIPTPSTGWVTDEADNCSVPTVTWLNDSSDGLTCPETISRTFEVTDNCGNSIEVVQLIVVMDVDAPVADIAMLPTETAFCDVTLSAPTATDNCSGSITGTTTTVFPINTLGTTTVTWEFIDECGNTSSQTQDVIIESIEVGTWIANDGVSIVSSNVSTGVTYQWYDCLADSILPGQTNHNLTPTYGSDFAVIVTQEGCADTSACTNSVVGIDELTINHMTIYPNPTLDGNFRVVLDGKIKTIDVIDMLGRTISLPTQTEDGIVDGSQLAQGKYMVKVTTTEGNVIISEVVIHK